MLIERIVAVVALVISSIESSCIGIHQYSGQIYIFKSAMPRNYNRFKLIAIYCL